MENLETSLKIDVFIQFEFIQPMQLVFGRSNFQLCSYQKQVNEEQPVKTWFYILKKKMQMKTIFNLSPRIANMLLYDKT